jgi:cellulose synthase/poly-beta-1,6-N-acetylglucosamine synthase-like glycosyltransferase
MTAWRAPASRDPVETQGIPTFSIAIALYQAADTVTEAVESALSQTLPALEVIVYDDGSADYPERALARYGDRIRLIRRPHRGVGAAKRAATEAASGEYVAILDADDVYLPTRLEALAQLAAARPDLGVLTTNAYLEAGGRFLRPYYDAEHPFPIEDQRAEILKRNFVLGNAAVKRALLQRIGGFDETLASAEDWDCWIRLILAGSMAGLIDEPLARYRLRPGGLSSRRVAHLRERVRVTEKVLSNPDLRPEERPIADSAVIHQRRQLAVAEARAALLEARPGAWRQALRVARDPGLPLGARARAATAAVAPGFARWLLERRERETWATAGGIRVARRPMSNAPSSNGL